MIYKIQINSMDEHIFESRKNAYAYAFRLIREGKRRVVIGKSANRTSYWKTDAIVMSKLGVIEIHKRDRVTGKSSRYILYSNGTTKRI